MAWMSSCTSLFLILFLFVRELILRYLNLLKLCLALAFAAFLFAVLVLLPLNILGSNKSGKPYNITEFASGLLGTKYFISLLFFIARLGRLAQLLHLQHHRTELPQPDEQQHHCLPRGGMPMLALRSSDLQGTAIASILNIGKSQADFLYAHGLSVLWATAVFIFLSFRLWMKVPLLCFPNSISNLVCR
jgi:hypothetical protein